MSLPSRGDTRAARAALVIHVKDYTNYTCTGNTKHLTWALKMHALDDAGASSARTDRAAARRRPGRRARAGGTEPARAATADRIDRAYGEYVARSCGTKQPADGRHHGA